MTHTTQHTHDTTQHPCNTTQQTCNTTQQTCNTTDLQHDTDNTYHPCTYINEIFSDRTISRGAAHVLIRLVTASGYHGYCYPSISTLCQWTNYKQTQLRHYLRQLVQAGHIRIIHTLGRSNEYQLTRIIPKSSRPLRSCGPRKRFIKRKRITDQENVISFRPPEQPPPDQNQGYNCNVGFTQEQTDNRRDNYNLETPKVHTKPPVNHYLLRQIMQLTGDKKSFGLWFKLVKTVDEQTIYQALSSLRSAIDCNTVNHRGRYLVGILKQLVPELFQEQTPRQAPTHQTPKVQDHTDQHQDAAPTTQRDHTLNMEQIRNIRALLSAKTPPETRPKKHISRNTQGNALDRLKFQFYGPGRVNHRQGDKVAEIVDKCLTLGVSEEIPAVSLINRART